MRMKPQQGRRGEKQKNTVTAIDRCQASCAPVGRTYISYQHRIESSSLDNPNRSQATHTPSVENGQHTSTCAIILLSITKTYSVQYVGDSPWYKLWTKLCQALLGGIHGLLITVVNVGPKRIKKAWSAPLSPSRTSSQPWSVALSVPR